MLIEVTKSREKALTKSAFDVFIASFNLYDVIGKSIKNVGKKPDKNAEKDDKNVEKGSTIKIKTKN